MGERRRAGQSLAIRSVITPFAVVTPATGKGVNATLVPIVVTSFAYRTRTLEGIVNGHKQLDIDQFLLWNYAS